MRQSFISTTTSYSLPLALFSLLFFALLFLGGCSDNTSTQDTTPIAGAQPRPTAQPGKIVIGSGPNAKQVPAEQLFPRKSQ